MYNCLYIYIDIWLVEVTVFKFHRNKMGAPQYPWTEWRENQQESGGKMYLRFRVSFILKFPLNDPIDSHTYSLVTLQ